MNISIDFLPGTHGNYLTFVLNKLLMGDELPIDSPLAPIGNSHIPLDSKYYGTDKPVNCYHWSSVFCNSQNQFELLKEQNLVTDKDGKNVIKITVEEEDLVVFYQLFTCRGYPRNLDPKTLEEDFYKKLTSSIDPVLPDTTLDEISLINSRYETATLDLYNLIRDKKQRWLMPKEMADKWPAITKPSDFLNLSDDVQQEYINRFGPPFLGCDEEYSSVPRFILRDHYKDLLIMILTDSNNSLNIDMREYSEPTEKFTDKNIYYFKFNDFYQKNKFLTEIGKIKDFFGLEFKDFDLEGLHEKFLAKQPQKNLRQKMDIIIRHISNKQPLDLTELTVIEEAYINSRVEQIYDVKLSLFDTIKFPKSVNELVKQYGLNK